MQSDAEKRKQAYLHQLRQSNQLTAYDFSEKKMVPIHNPHLVEDDGHFSVIGEYKGHHISKFVKPPPSC